MKGKMTPLALATVVLMVLAISIAYAVTVTPVRDMHGMDKGCMMGSGMMIGPPGGMMLERMRRELNLTDDQVARIRAIREEYMRDHATDFTRMMDLHMQLVTIMKEPGTSRVDDALAVRSDMDVIQDRLAQDGIRAIFDAKNVLTLDQQRRLSTMIDNMMMQHHGTRSMGSRPGRGAMGNPNTGCTMCDPNAGYF